MEMKKLRRKKLELACEKNIQVRSGSVALPRTKLVPARPARRVVDVAPLRRAVEAIEVRKSDEAMFSSFLMSYLGVLTIDGRVERLR